MKILQRNPKQGLVKLAVETADDLWYLHTLLDPKDVVTGQSEYKYKLGGADAKAKVVKKRVWVEISLEKTEFETGQLRISGSVVGGSEEVPRSSHHGIDVEVGDTISVQKETWLDFHNDKLKEAEQSAKLKTLLVLFDREHALFALLKPNGHETLLKLKGDVSKKAVDEKKQGSFYKEIVEKLTDYEKRYGLQRAIAASPSFWGEYLKKELTPELSKKVIFTAVSSADESAISELLKRPELQKALEGERAAREQNLLEGIMSALGKDMLVYGMDDLQAAVSEGNVKELTVTENEIMRCRETDTFSGLDSLMKAASTAGAKVHLLSTKEAMGKIDGLGGVVGIKRW